MNHRVLGLVAAAAAIAFAQPVAYLAARADKAADVLAAARQAIGGGQLNALTTFSLHASVQRNLANTQIDSDVEVLLELPGKYLRQESPRGGGITFAGGGVSGFNGSRALQKPGAGGFGRGGMMIRMGGGGPPAAPAAGKPTPEQLDAMNGTLVRDAQAEASRLMLGWFAMAHPAAGARYTYAGDAESPDGKAFVIDVSNGGNLKARLFIDHHTYLPLMVTYRAPQPRMITVGGPPVSARASGGGHIVRTAPSSERSTSEEERPKTGGAAERQIQETQRQAPDLVDYSIFFEDWRDADGVKFPFKLRRGTAGTTTEEWTVDEIKVNPRIDPKRFSGSQE